jgi:hypothetical protein
MKWILLVALIVACDPRKPIGENYGGPDAQVDGTGGSDSNGGSDASTTCSCDVTSCGSRVCGRSDCGYPCGTCTPGTTCFLGVSCNGPAGGTCIDAFGDQVGEFDVGFRACPGDPTKQQRCQCSGNGPDAWTSCETTCIEICTTTSTAPMIACGSSVCGAGQVCCIPNTNMGSDVCATGACPSGYATRACDGPEDCSTGSSCCGGDLVDPYTATCGPSGSCTGVQELCHTGADCPASKPYCCPALLVSDVGGCSETNSPDCT